MSSSVRHTPSNPSNPPTLDEVDASFRAVALFLVGKSAFWLLVGSFLLLLASVKIHAPGMMAGAAWATYGRLAPAGWDVLVYGFAGQAGFAVGLWLLARASMQRLQSPLLVLAGGVLWNLGVLAGTIGILAGHSTGRELLEMPPGAFVCLVVAAGLIGSAGWMTYAARTETQSYPSAWFALLALISFVWFGSVALMMLAGEGPRGVVQVLVQRWFANGILNLWLGGLGLAAIFHWLPALLGRPLASRSLALIAFWSLAFFAPWGITEHGDPFPRWIVSAGLAGRFLAATALFAIALNWWKTSEGALDALFATPQGRLIGVAGYAYLASGTLDFLMTFRGASAGVRFTWIHQGLDWLLVGGAVIAALFAIIPDLLARATGQALNPRWIRLHAALTIFGVLLTALPLVVGGLIQGSRLGDPTIPFLDALRSSLHLVRLSSLGLVAFLSGQVIFLIALSGLFKSLTEECAATVKSWTVSKSKERTAGVRS
ncbi:MAG: cbb3-type cytochrome c oxidase subunit I [Limisphaerales bacterium]